MFTLQKKSSKRISRSTNMRIVVPFLYGPILPQRSHFIVGLWWASGPTLAWYWPNFTPNYGVMMSPWIFSVLFELIIVNWNPFQRWFSEVALVSWHINFISRSYGWGVRARFVIFGCSLPHLTIYPTHMNPEAAKVIFLT